MPPEEAEDALEMARYTGPRTKVSRRARQLLDENKAKYFDRRPYPPGRARPWPHSRIPVPGPAPREAEAASFIVRRAREAVPSLLQARPHANRGITGTNLLQSSWRAGSTTWCTAPVWHRTRPQARQLVNHGHFLVNDKQGRHPLVSDPVGRTMLSTVKERSRRDSSDPCIAIDTLVTGPSPEWIEVDRQRAEDLHSATFP